jgi:hypothetical protein
MQAGARHPVPLWRRPSRTFVVLAALAWCAIAPGAAQAAALDSTVQSAVQAAPQPVQQAAQDVVSAARPAAGREPAAPAPQADGGAVQQAVEPIAGTSGAAVPSAAAAVPAAHLREPVHARVSHISADASAAHRPHGENGPRPGSSNRVAASSRPAADVVAGSRRAHQAGGVGGAPRPAAAPAQPAPEPFSGYAGADGIAPSASSGFFFGGGFALLVAALLLAGPRLRRRLMLLPAVCRPAAFHVVLERPG